MAPPQQPAANAWGGRGRGSGRGAGGARGRGGHGRPAHPTVGFAVLVLGLCFGLWFLILVCCGG